MKKSTTYKGLKVVISDDSGYVMAWVKTRAGFVSFQMLSQKMQCQVLRLADEMGFSV